MINDIFKKIAVLILFVLILYSFNVYALVDKGDWIKMWGYCAGPECPPQRDSSDNLIFYTECNGSCNSVTKSDYDAAYYCQYEGNYYFDAKSSCELQGTTNVGAYGPVFNISWDNDKADCECYGKIWLNQIGGPATCCGDAGDSDDFCVEQGFNACSDGIHYTDGDSNEYTCSCGGGLWALGGDSSATTCCEDDNEYVLYRKGQIVNSNDVACCNSDTDCVWNSGCLASRDTVYDIDGDMHRCTNGEWGPALEEKCNTDNSACGYCDDTGMQCYVSAGNCVDEGTFILGDFCEKGKWTTRTKLISLQLLDIADQLSPEDYTLFCDSYENTLNYYGYSILGIPVVQHLREVNNICVLRLPNQVIFGASLNAPIDQGRFIETLIGVNNCNNAIDDDDQFDSCGSSSRVYYNDNTQSVIYSNSDFPMRDIDLWNKFLFFLKNPFQSIFNFLFNLFRQERIGLLGDYDFINHTKDFSRIYLNRKNLKSIYGVAEEIEEPLRGEYISVTYNGYKDICSTVDVVYDKFRRQGQLGRKDLVLCYYDQAAGSYYVASNSSTGIALWPELTARLRP